jgi:hypothetical protein
MYVCEDVEVRPESVATLRTVVSSNSMNVAVITEMVTIQGFTCRCAEASTASPL